MSFLIPFLFTSILSPLLTEYDTNIKSNQEQVFFLKVKVKQFIVLARQVSFEVMVKLINGANNHIL